MAELIDKCKESKADKRSPLNYEMAEILRKRHDLNPEEYHFCHHTRGIECSYYCDLLRLRSFGLCRKKQMNFS